jgi:hypothetical protein
MQTDHNLSRTLEQDLQHKRNLQMARIEREKKIGHEKTAHNQKIAQSVSRERFQGYNAVKNDKKSESEQERKNDIRSNQRGVRKVTNDREIHIIVDDITDIATSSKTMMPMNVIKAAIHAREALHDYKSKLWIVGFTVAFFKDTIGDISYFLGIMAQIYLVIFLFGGGFLKKQAGKLVLKRVIIPIIIGFIPVLNIIVPDAIIQVYVRWHISKKEYKKAEAYNKAISNSEEF